MLKLYILHQLNLSNC